MMNARLLTRLVLLVFVPGLFAASTTTAPALREQPASVRIVVDVIEAVVDQNILSQLDFQKIDPPRHRVDQLLAALNKNGKATLATRFDNSVMSSGEVSLQSGQNQPFITGSNISGKTGSVSRTIEYKNVGAICQCTILPPTADGSFPIRGTAEWSGVADSGIPITEGVNAPVHLKTQMRISPILAPDKPVLISTMIKLPDRPDGVRRFQAVLFRLVANPGNSDSAVEAANHDSKPSTLKDRQPK